MGAIDELNSAEWIESREAELREGACRPFSEDNFWDGVIWGPESSITDQESDLCRAAAEKGDSAKVGEIVIEMVRRYWIDRAASQAQADWTALCSGKCVDCHEPMMGCRCEPENLP